MKTILKDFLDIEIRPTMKQLGYRKSGGLFHRQDGSFLYTIEFFTPPSAVTEDEFRISASIFSFDIADVIGYLSNSKAPKDLHLSHYSLYHNPVLPQKYADRDLIYIQDGRETYISERLIKAFKEAGIKGIEFNATGSLRFIQTDV